MTDALDRLSRRMGILGSYTDPMGARRTTPRATRRALLAAMGLPLEASGDAAAHLARITDADARRALPEWAVCTAGQRPGLAPPPAAAWQLTREDGTTTEGRGPLPALPLGLHRLTCGADVCTLIAAPARLPLPPRGWGVGLPLFGLRTAAQGGLADYADLADAGATLAGHGAGFVGLNPLHAGFLTDAGAISPYTPSHRRRLNALHVPVDLAGAPGGPLLSPDTDLPRRRAALRAAFGTAAPDDPRFAAFRRAEGPALDRFALHQALSDRLGPYWHDWPAAYHDPASPEVARAAHDMTEDVAFHAWLQWRAATALGAANDRLRAAGMAHGLYLDLAVGTHPAGAETWEDRASFAFGASLGAPPDAFSADGQSWGLAPFNPHALVAGGFAALAETLRCQLAHAGLLRVDHILGFNRAFWVPDGGGTPGAYVAMPQAAMLAVLRLEAARAGAAIVGEDLGNVPRGLRPQMAASGILGCRVLMFEQTGADTAPAFRPPQAVDRAAMASFSTHDLPTWRGWRAGADIAARARLGHIDAATGTRETARRAAEIAAFDTMTAPHRPPDTPAASVAAMHHALGASRAQLALVQIENVLDIADQPNLPGTTDEYPNWRQRLPQPLDSPDSARRLAATARIMAAHGR